MNPIKAVGAITRIVVKQAQSGDPHDLRNNPPGAALAQKIHDITVANRSGNLTRLLNPTDLTSWRTGYEGEVITGDLLNTLKSQGYTIIHSVPLGKRGADIDHLVITPTGHIYNINTKHHPGKTVTIDGPSLRVNGQPQHHLTQAHDEATKLQAKLKAISIPRKNITPLVVIVGSSAVRIKTKPVVIVVTATDLLTHIRQAEAQRVCLGHPPVACPPRLYDHAFWQQDGKHLADHALTRQLDNQLVIKELAELAAVVAPVIIGVIKKRQQRKG